MKPVQFSDNLLLFVNLVFGLASLAMMAQGVLTGNGLTGVGAAVLAASVISYAGLRLAINQERREASPRPSLIARPVSGASGAYRAAS